jgi:hypothetical protein
MKGGNFVNFTFFKEVDDLEGVSSRHSMRQFKKEIATLPFGKPRNDNSSAVIARSEATKQSQREIATPLACRRLAI